MSYPAGTISANGVSVPIFVSDQGRWEAEYAGRSLGFETRDKLETAIKRLTKTTTVPVAVAFVRIEKRGTAGIAKTAGTATGIHAGNGNVLVVWHQRHGDVKDQIKSPSYQTVDFGGVDDDVLAEYGDLVAAAARAEKAADEFRAKYKIDLKDEVLNAIKKATEEGQSA